MTFPNGIGGISRIGCNNAIVSTFKVYLRQKIRELCFLFIYCVISNTYNTYFFLFKLWKCILYILFISSIHMQNMWHVVCLQKSGSSDIFEDLSFQRFICRKTAEHQYDTWRGDASWILFLFENVGNFYTFTIHHRLLLCVSWK